MDSSNYSAFKKSSTQRPPSPLVRREQRSQSFTRKKGYYLSKILEKQPKVLNDKNLNCSQKSIKTIDEIPYVFKNVEYLNLSRNMIASLSGIEQFKKTKIIDLSNNSIEHLTSLFPIKDLKNLETLNLDNNPVLNNRNFLDTVVSLVPNLRILNDKPVTLEDKLKSKNNLKNQLKSLEKLLHNYCEILKLQSIYNKLIIMENLIKVDPGYAIPNRKYLNFSTLIKHCNFVFTMDEKALSHLRIDLMEDVQLLQETRESDEMNAYSLLETKQIEKIEEICTLIEEKIKQLKSYKLEPPREPITMTTKTRFSSQIVPSQSPIKYHLDIELSNILRKPNMINESEQKVVKNMKIVKEVHKSDLNRSDLNTSKNYEKAILTRSSVKTKQNNENSANLPPSKANQSLIQDKGIQKILNDTMKLGQAINNSNVFSPVKKFISEKDKLISELGLNLNQKIDEVTILEEMNNCLKNQLEELQDNYQHAEKNLETKMLDVNYEKKQYLEEMKTMEQEIRSNQEKINELVLRNHELQKHNEKFSDYNMKLNVYENKLKEISKLEELEDHAIRFYETKLLQKYYEHMKIGVSKIARINELLRHQKLIKEREITERFFGFWQKSYLISKIIQTKKLEKNNTLIYQSFKNWVKFIKLRYQMKRNQDNKAKRIQLICFIYWKKYNQAERKIQVLKARQDKFKKINVRKRFLRLWVEGFRSVSLTPTEEKVSMRRAEYFRNINLKNLFFSFLDDYKQERINLQILNEKADNHNISIIKIRTIYGWKNIAKQNKIMLQKAEAFRQQKIRNLVWRTLNDWFFRNKCEKIKRTKFQNLENWFIKRKRFRQWKIELDAAVNFRANVNRIENTHNRNLKSLVIKSFKKFWYSQKRMIKTLDFLVNKNETNLLRNVFKSFKILLSQRKLIKQKISYLNKQKLNAYFVSWFNIHHILTKKKQALNSLIIFRENLEKEKLKTCFNAIQIKTKNSKRLSKILNKIDITRRKEMITRLFSNLQKESILQLKQKLSDKENHISTLEEILTENKKTMIKMENLYKEIYLEKTEVQNRNNALKTKLEENLNFIKEQKLSIQQNEKTLKQIDLDLKEKNDSVKRLSKDLDDLNDELDRRSNEYEDQIKEKTSENKALLLKTEDINRQLQQKENLLLSLEKQLFNKSVEADQIIRDLEKKNEVNMAALEEKDFIIKRSFSEVEDLKNIVSEYNEELLTKDSKLEGLFNELSETKAYFESKINQYENKNKNQINEIQILKETNKNYLSKLSDLTVDNKFLQSQVKLLKDDDNNNVDEYLKKLNQRKEISEERSNFDSITIEPRPVVESIKPTSPFKSSTASITQISKPDNSLEVLEKLNRDVEGIRLSRSQLKDDIEKRMKMLNQSLDVNLDKTKNDSLLANS